MYYGTHYKSPAGDILLVGDENHIISLSFEGQKYSESTVPGNVVEQADVPVLCEAVRWLEDYFAGKRPAPSLLPLAPIGGEFRRLVWKLLLEIPYGEVTTYGNIAGEAAKRMGKARMSAQAVGGAIGHNPIGIVIPCHRVVGADGSLTGYAGGLERKKMLLEHEGIDVTKLHVTLKEKEE